MPEVTICTENVVIPALGAAILFKCERMENLIEFFVWHLPVCLLLLIEPHLRYIAGVACNRQESEYDAGVG
jgi:hypothetical protein